MSEGTAERLTLDFRDLAALTGVSEHTIRRLSAKGELPFKSLKLGRRTVFAKAQVLAVLGAKEERGH